MSAENGSPMGLFERYLSLWVALCIAAGVMLGITLPALFQVVASIEYASVNLVVAVFIWVMIYPMMINVDFASLKDVGKKPKGLCITLVVNCFVWSQLVRGDANYTLVQVSINDIIMVFAFAPLAAFLLGVTNIVVPWETLLLSVVLYVVIPLLAGYATRRILDRAGQHERITRFTAAVKPFSIMGLLATVILLFGFQAQTILDKPLVIALIAIPLLIQSYGIFAIAYGWAYLWRVPFDTAAPAALIGTSNFFELAVAVAISLFGLNSGAALATVVGVLVEVPVMLSLVFLANRTRQHFAQTQEPA
jgi:ACR3 family arsenite transporter